MSIPLTFFKSTFQILYHKNIFFDCFLWLYEIKIVPLHSLIERAASLIYDVNI